MRILLLRASEDAARSAKALESLGHEVVISPVIVFSPIEAPLPEGAFDALLATSAQAFSGLAESHLAKDQIARLRSLPLYCVGSRTALIAQEAGLEAPRCTARDTVDLAASLIAAYPAPARFLYLAGSDRKPDLETLLTDAGHSVSARETYRAAPAEQLSGAARSLLERGGIDAILHYSRRSVEIFLSLAASAQLDASAPAHLCLSADVALPLQRAGYEHIVIADAPTENALFDKLQER